MYIHHSLMIQRIFNQFTTNSSRLVNYQQEDSTICFVETKKKEINQNKIYHFLSLLDIFKQS